MLFQVLRNNKVMMSTNYEECIPPPDILIQMMNAGYTFKKNNKSWKPPKQSISKVKESKRDEN